MSMETFALVLMVCGGTAVLALAFSLTRHGRAARRLALISLWLTLGAVPAAIAIDVTRLWLGADGAGSKAFLVGKTISHAMNYGALALPCAALAGLALRRARSRRSTRS